VAAGPGTRTRTPGCGQPGAGGAGVVSRLRPATPSPRGGDDLPSAAQGTSSPRMRSLGVCGHAAGPAGVRGPCACCGSRARPHVWLRLPAPRGGRPAAPRGRAAPRGAAAPRSDTRLVLAHPHVPAPDVSGPRWPRPWERLLIPDQKARRQWTGRSYTPRELEPAQAAPLTPRPWKPMPRMSAGRHPPAPKAGAVNLRGLTVHRPR